MVTFKFYRMLNKKKKYFKDKFRSLENGFNGLRWGATSFYFELFHFDGLDFSQHAF